MEKILRLEKFFLIMQKFLHDAAKITFCSLERPGYDLKSKANNFSRHQTFSGSWKYTRNLTAQYQVVQYHIKNSIEYVH